MDPRRDAARMTVVGMARMTVVGMARATVVGTARVTTVGNDGGHRKDEGEMR